MISNARIAELTDYREAKAKDGFAFCQIPTHELAALIARLASAEAALKPFSMCAPHGKYGGAFVIARATYELDATPRESNWHWDQFAAAADHFAKLKDTDHD